MYVPTGRIIYSGGPHAAVCPPLIKACTSSNGREGLLSDGAVVDGRGRPIIWRCRRGRSSVAAPPPPPPRSFERAHEARARRASPPASRALPRNDPAIASWRRRPPARSPGSAPRRGASESIRQRDDRGCADRVTPPLFEYSILNRTELVLLSTLAASRG